MTKAQVLQAELEKLKGADGLIQPRDVVQFARTNPDSALHGEFEWDDGAAAEAYRVQQARQIIRLCVTVVVEDKPPMRAFVSLPTDRANHGGYRTLEDVVTDSSRRAEMVQDVLQRLHALKRKYTLLTELLPVWEALDKVSEEQQPPAAATG